MRYFMLIIIQCFILASCVPNKENPNNGTMYNPVSSSAPHIQSGIQPFSPLASNSSMASMAGPSQHNIKLIGHWKTYIFENAGQKTVMMDAISNSRANFTIAVSSLNGRIVNFYSLVTPNILNWPSGATINRAGTLIIGDKAYAIQTNNNVDNFVISSMIQMPPDFTALASRNQYFSINLQGVQIAQISLVGFQQAFAYAAEIAKQIE